MKKFFAGLTLAAAAAGLLAGCNVTTDNSLVTELLATKQNLYGFSAATSVSLLSDASFLAASKMLAPKMLPGDMGPGSETIDTRTEEEKAADITRYMGIMDQLLSEDAPIVVTSETSDLTEYAFKLKVVTTSLTLEKSTYYIYFNEIVAPVDETSSSEVASSEISSEIVSSEVVSSEVLSSEIASSEVTSTSIVSSSNPSSDPTVTSPTTWSGRAGMNNGHGNSHEDNEWNNHDESSQTSGISSETPEEVELKNENEDCEDYSNFEEGQGYEDLATNEDEYQNHEGHGMGEDLPDGEFVNLEGIVVVNDVQYALVGSTHGDKTSFFLSIDANNWIRMSQEVEVGEVNFKITMEVNGVRNKVSFKSETDEDGLKVSLFMLQDGVKTSYSFRKVMEEGVETIFIRVIENGVVTHVKAVAGVDPVTGGTIYTYTFLESGHRYEHKGDHDYNEGHGHGRN